MSPPRVHPLAEEIKGILAELYVVLSRAERVIVADREAPAAGPSRMLDAAEVSARLGISRAAVYRLGRKGQAGVCRVGSRAMRFDEAALVEWVRHGGIAPRSHLKLISTDDGRG